MNVQKLMVNHAGYNLWANQKIVNWLVEKPVEQLNQEVPSSFSSMLKTLNHIWAIEAYWYSVIFQYTEVENRYGVEDLQTEEIFEGLISRSTLLANDIQSFMENDFTEQLKVVSPWLEANQPRYEYVLQLVNHGTYHRGQLVTIARNIGLTDIPNTDYVFFIATKENSDRS